MLCTCEIQVLQIRAVVQYLGDARIINLVAAVHLQVGQLGTVSAQQAQRFVRQPAAVAHVNSLDKPRPVRGTTQQQPLEDRLQHLVAPLLLTPQRDRSPTLGTLPAQRLEPFAHLTHSQQVGGVEQREDLEGDPVRDTVKQARLQPRASLLVQSRHQHGAAGQLCESRVIVAFPRPLLGIVLR